MPADIFRREDCRLCGSKKLRKVLSLTPTPLANAFVPEARKTERQKTYPLDVFFCEACAHVQLLDVVDPAELFENYVYISGTSPVFVQHFQDYAEWAEARFIAPRRDALVVDIGSNDGTLLWAFQQRGCRVLGVDPAKEIAKAASAEGTETIPAFFTPMLADDIRIQKGPAQVVMANNVFAHADDLTGIVNGVKKLLDEEGVFVFEVSYLGDVFENALFDTIYHEHLAYHSVKPLKSFFERNGMELIEVKREDTHGGSIRGVAQLQGAGRPMDASVDNLIAYERGIGLHQSSTLIGFGARIDTLKAEFAAMLKRLKSQGHSIAGFGSPAKATTLMYHLGVGPGLIDFIVDDSPLKQGLYTPGLHVPVLPADALYERKPDYVVILAWNFAKPIMEKHEAFSEAGGQFIVPLPKVEIY